MYILVIRQVWGADETMVRLFLFFRSPGSPKQVFWNRRGCLALGQTERRGNARQSRRSCQTSGLSQGQGWGRITDGCLSRRHKGRTEADEDDDDVRREPSLKPTRPTRPTPNSPGQQTTRLLFAFKGFPCRWRAQPSQAHPRFPLSPLHPVPSSTMPCPRFPGKPGGQGPIPTVYGLRPEGISEGGPEEGRFAQRGLIAPSV